MRETRKHEGPILIHAIKLKKEKAIHLQKKQEINIMEFQNLMFLTGEQSKNSSKCAIIYKSIC